MDVASTCTTDSAASEKIAAEPVTKYAPILAKNIPMPIDREIQAAFFFNFIWLSVFISHYNLANMLAAFLITSSFFAKQILINFSFLSSE